MVTVYKPGSAMQRFPLASPARLLPGPSHAHLHQSHQLGCQHLFPVRKLHRIRHGVHSMLRPNDVVCEVELLQQFAL